MELGGIQAVEKAHKCIFIRRLLVSSFKDSTDRKACLLEIISNQMERAHWSKELDSAYHESRIQELKELVSALGARIQNQRKELGVDEQGW